jgi:tetratricopeptide (TPR) repeat protein
MRDRVPPLERALIEVGYFVLTSQRDSQIAADERALALDPNQTTVLNDLGNLYRTRREPVRAESAYRKAIALNEGYAGPSVNIVSALVEQGKVAEAKTQIAEGLRRFPTNSATPLNHSANIAIMETRYDSAEKLLALAGRSERSSMSRNAGTYLAAVREMRGHPGAYLRLQDSLFERDRAAENVRSLDAARVTLTLDSIHVENWMLERHAEAARRLDALVAARQAPGGLSPGSLLSVAREYAWADQPEKARSALTRFDREVHDPVELRRQSSARPWTEGEVALAARQYAVAIAKIRASDSLYDGRPQGCLVCTDAALGRAFDLAGMADSAIAAFERYVSRPAAYRFTVDAEYLAGAHKRLGELYEAKGDKQKAASYYAKFIALWKDADPELQPKVAEVRRRLARLSDQEVKR